MCGDTDNPRSHPFRTHTHAPAGLVLILYDTFVIPLQAFEVDRSAPAGLSPDSESIHDVGGC